MRERARSLMEEKDAQLQAARVGHWSIWPHMAHAHVPSVWLSSMHLSQKQGLGDCGLHASPPLMCMSHCSNMMPSSGRQGHDGFSRIDGGCLAGHVCCMWSQALGSLGSLHSSICLPAVTAHAQHELWRLQPSTLLLVSFRWQGEPSDTTGSGGPRVNQRAQDIHILPLSCLPACLQSRRTRSMSFGASEPSTPLPVSFRGQGLLSDTGSGDHAAELAAGRPAPEPALPSAPSVGGQYGLDRMVSDPETKA